MGTSVRTKGWSREELFPGYLSLEKAYIRSVKQRREYCKDNQHLTIFLDFLVDDRMKAITTWILSWSLDEGTGFLYKISAFIVKTPQNIIVHMKGIALFLQSLKCVKNVKH